MGATDGTCGFSRAGRMSAATTAAYCRMVPGDDAASWSERDNAVACRLTALFFVHP